MGWRSFVRHIHAEGIRRNRKIRREERKDRRSDRKRELRAERKDIKSRGLPPPYIGEIRYGYDIPHKRKDNSHRYIYKHVAQSSKYEWVKIDLEGDHNVQ